MLSKFLVIVPDQFRDISPFQFLFSGEKRKRGALPEVSCRSHQKWKKILRAGGICGREEKYGRIELQAVVLARLEMTEGMDLVNVYKEHVSLVYLYVAIRHGRRKPAADPVNDLNKIVVMGSDLTALIPFFQKMQAAGNGILQMRAVKVLVQGIFCGVVILVRHGILTLPLFV